VCRQAEVAPMQQGQQQSDGRLGLLALSRKALQTPCMPLQVLLGSPRDWLLLPAWRTSTSLPLGWETSACRHSQQASLAAASSAGCRACCWVAIQASQIQAW
jgi:hypothetical protein